MSSNDKERVYGVFNCKSKSYSNGLRAQFVREKLGLTQRDLARILRINSGQVCMWENGVNPIPLPMAVIYELLCDKIITTDYITKIANRADKK